MLDHVSAESAIVELLRGIAPRVLGAIARRYGDFDAAEDAVQEALITATTRWASSGIPDNPGGWLYQVATRRMADHLRSEIARRRREAIVASRGSPDEFVAWPTNAGFNAEHDDILLLLFTCCHPSLTPPSAIALTLRAVGGLTTAEIANAFLVPEATMAQRISRAKRTIRESGSSLRMPSAQERAERLSVVLQILYLIFNEGYVSSSGAMLIRTDLSREAIRLTRLLHDHLPEDPEVAGLLALMILTDARRAARTGPNGELIPLDEQDRSLWDRKLIAEGTALLSHALSRGAVGAYQLQAAIAAVHDEAKRYEDTDWPQILALYGLLRRIADNPMVALNHAVATAMVHGPRVGLDLLVPLADDPRLGNHFRLDAVRAHLLELDGRHVEALAHYRAAAERATSIPERNYLLSRAARLSGPSPGPGTKV